MPQEIFNVINFHLTEKCNYKCKYCFAKFYNKKEFTKSEWFLAVDTINQYFTRNNVVNGRINLAGGEPLLVPYLDNLIDYINTKGIKVSIITNGSLLTLKKIDNWIGKVDTIGVSIDSIDKTINQKIGRHNNFNVLDIEELIKVLNYAKKHGIKIKVNTVVSRFNIDENIIKLYEQIDFDRIKVLQIRINIECNEKAKEFKISDEEFYNYQNRVKETHPEVIFESEIDLESSYVIIDPKGNLISNKQGVQSKVGSILSQDLESLSNIADININRFNKRYQMPQEDLDK